MGVIIAFKEGFEGEPKGFREAVDKIFGRHSKQKGKAQAASGLEKSYTDIQAKIKSTLGDYCELTTYVHEQMKEIYMTAKPDASGNSTPGDSESQAEAHILKTYKDVYNCKDDLAGSRASCNAVPSALSMKPENTDEFVSCSEYISPPAWTSNDDTLSQAIALAQIHDNLESRVTKELEWYSQIIKMLTDAIAAGNNPSAVNVPTSEGFYDSGKCTLSQMQARQAELKRKKDAEDADARAKAAAAAASATASCTIPSLDSEIKRVNSILSSPGLAAALKSSASLKAAMMKLKSDQAKLKAGTLYSWQQAPSSKSYKKYDTSDRTSGLVASMQQNRE